MDRLGRTAKWVAIITGVVFVLAGLPKLVAFRWELAIFVRLELPRPEAWVIAAGLVEIIGGALLIARWRVRLASIALALTMSVAIGVSGIRKGDVVPSLTLAPALLIACLYLASRTRSRP